MEARYFGNQMTFLIFLKCCQKVRYSLTEFCAMKRQTLKKISYLFPGAMFEAL